MTYLFDTNAWLRYFERPQDLSPKALALLSDGANFPIALSAISIWEVCLKVRQRKLILSLPLDQWLSAALRPSVVHVIPIDAALAKAAHELPAPFHEDPADRLIAATARLHNLKIVTSDAKILAYPHVLSVW